MEFLFSVTWNHESMVGPGAGGPDRLEGLPEGTGNEI